MSKFVSLDYWNRGVRVREILAVRNIEKVCVLPWQTGIELVEREPNGRVYRNMNFDSHEELEDQYNKFLAALVEG